MKIEDYERRAEELTKEAQKLEATMLTFKALAECEKGNHSFDYWYEPEQKFIQGCCTGCGIYIKAENYTMWFTEDNEEGFGELAGKSLEDIEIELSDPLPTEVKETDDKPSVPLEQDKDKGGAYRVDVSEIIGRNK